MLLNSRQQRVGDTVSESDIRQAIASLIASPGKKCNVLKNLASRQPEQNLKKHLLIYLADEVDDENQLKIKQNFQNSYAIGLRYATGGYKALGTAYDKLFNAQNMQDEINKLVFWSTEKHFVRILNDAKVNFCYEAKCYDYQKCLRYPPSTGTYCDVIIDE